MLLYRFFSKYGHYFLKAFSFVSVPMGIFLLFTIFTSETPVENREQWIFVLGVAFFLIVMPPLTVYIDMWDKKSEREEERKKLEQLFLQRLLLIFEQTYYETKHMRLSQKENKISQVIMKYYAKELKSLKSKRYIDIEEFIAAGFKSKAKQKRLEGLEEIRKELLEKYKIWYYSTYKTEPL